MRLGVHLAALHIQVGHLCVRLAALARTRLAGACLAELDAVLLAGGGSVGSDIISTISMMMMRRLSTAIVPKPCSKGVSPRYSM